MTFPRTGRTRRRLILLVQIVLTTAILWLIWRACDWQTFRSVWQQADSKWWWACGALFAAYFTLGWWSLTSLLNTRLSAREWRYGLLQYGALQAVATFTPGRAAEVALPFAYKADDGLRGEMAAALVVQRVTSLACVALVAVVFGTRWLPLQAAVAILACVAAGTLLLFALIAQKRLRSFVGNYAETRLRVRVPGFYDAWRNIWQDARGRLVAHITMMVIRILTHAAAGYAVILSLRLDVPFLAWLALTAVASISQMVPLSVWGLGIVEGVVVLGLAGFDVPPESALVLCLACRGIMLVMMAAWTIAFSLVRAYASPVIPTPVIPSPDSPPPLATESQHASSNSEHTELNSQDGERLRV